MIKDGELIVMEKTKNYLIYRQGVVSENEGDLPIESHLTIRVNGDKLATLMCTPK